MINFLHFITGTNTGMAKGVIDELWRQASCFPWSLDTPDRTGLRARFDFRTMPFGERRKCMTKRRSASTKRCVARTGLPC
jgi:hypothetical protein